MEKRIILSFLLCFLVLIVWQKRFPEQMGGGAVKNLQYIENKGDIEKNQNLLKQEEDSRPIEAPEDLVDLQNGKILIGMSPTKGTIQLIRLLENDVRLPLEGLAEIKDEGLAGISYKIEKRGANEIVFSATQGGLFIRKIYRISDQDYLISLDIEVENKGAASAKIDPKIEAIVLNLNKLEENTENGREQSLLEYSINTGEKVIRKTSAYKFSLKEEKTELLPVQWVGFRNRYYCAIFKPNFSTIGYRIQVFDKKKVGLFVLGEKSELAPGEKSTLSSSIYFGPQSANILAGHQMGFEKIHVYFRAGFFDAIAKIIEDLMVLMHKIIPNWGLSIIFASLFIYLMMYPLTIKSIVSMRKMQELQPKIVELREKYETNPQKLNQEIMKLYAENKANPLGGCLPLLLQMPIFICLYQVIWRSPFFNGANFLWIKDLSAPDRLIVFTSKYPIIGNEFNILPVLIVILMVFQQKMTTKNMTITDPNQLAQQKMMLFVMPVMLFVFFYHLASGLSLYLMVFYILSTFTQWKAAKMTKAVNA